MLGIIFLSSDLPFTIVHRPGVRRACIQSSWLGYLSFLPFPFLFFFLSFFFFLFFLSLSTPLSLLFSSLSSLRSIQYDIDVMIARLGRPSH